MSRKKKVDYVTIYTDASFCPKTKTGGWACWIKHGEGQKIEYASHIPGECKSSLEAEMLGILGGIAVVRNHVEYVRGSTVLVVVTDCQDAIDFINGTKTNYNKNKNFDLYKTLARLIHEQRPAKTHLNMKKVKAHSDNDGVRSWVNNRVDEEAKRVMRHYRDWKKQQMVGESNG